jgi:hypothetical protein
MEEANGVQLESVWMNMQLRAKLDIVEEIVDAERKMLSVSFDKSVGFLMANGTQNWHTPTGLDLYISRTTESQDVKPLPQQHHPKKLRITFNPASQLGQ